MTIFGASSPHIPAFTLDDLEEKKQIHWRRRRKMPIGKALLIVLFIALLLTGLLYMIAPEPSIQITHPANAGTFPQMDSIEGQVVANTPSYYKVVIYSYTDKWYVQPFENSPKTTIISVGPWLWKWSQGKWAARVHCGSEYAALLVNPGYNPPNQTDAPPQSADILSIHVIPARPVQSLE